MVWTAKNAVVFQPKNAVHAKGMHHPRLVKYTNKVLPLLPTWPTNCRGVKGKLLKPWKWVCGLLEGWGTKCCSVLATCSSENKSRCFTLYYHLAFPVHFSFPGTVGNLLCSTATCWLREHPCSSTEQLQSWQQPRSTGCWVCRGKATGNTLTYVSRLLQNPPIPCGQAGDSGSDGRARGGSCLQEVSNQCCTTTCSSSSLAACREHHNGRAQRWRKYDRPGLLAACLWSDSRDSVLLQCWKCQRGCCYLLCSNTGRGSICLSLLLARAPRLRGPCPLPLWAPLAAGVVAEGKS